MRKITRLIPKFILLTVLILLSLSPVWAAKVTTVKGKVVAVKDGDTIVILKNKTEYTIRLTGIDCPEKKQAFGMKAKQFASDQAFGKTVTAKIYSKDRYKRSLADIILPNGKILNYEMVRAGLAWHYKQYSKDAKLAELERQARKQKIGLWVDKDPVPPWQFRRHKK
jgi:endonuclease YncB( thermonuclease family)